MRILVTNDDGIYSPGIRALAEIAKGFGQVKILAPDIEQSSMGHAITHSSPLYYKKSAVPFEGIDAYRMNGTPADCVSLGTHLWSHTDLVLSGINLGANLGNAIWHSGTLAAARQAALLGVKGIALSTPVGKNGPDFDRLKPFVRAAIAELLTLPGTGLYNVNFPPKPKDVLWTRQSVRFYDGKVIPAVDPAGKKYYWITVVPLEEAEEGTDRWAMENDFVSITPLRLDLSLAQPNSRK